MADMDNTNVSWVAPSYGEESEVEERGEELRGKASQGSGYVGAVVVSDDDGNEKRTNIEVSQLLSAIETDSGSKRLQTIMDGSYTVQSKDYGGGLVEVDVHPDLEAAYSDEIPLPEFGGAGLAPGFYFGLYDMKSGESLDDDEAEHVREGARDGLLLATDSGQVSGEHVELMPVTIYATDENGEEQENPPYPPLELWLIKNTETDDYATVNDLLRGLLTIAAMRVLLESGAVDLSLGDDVQGAIEEQLPEIEPAIIKTETSFTNHSLAMKAVRGMVDIAFGEKSYTLSPGNKKSKSKEEYVLTASTDACARLFYEDKASPEHVMCVLEKAHTMRTDKRAEGFIYRGRVWFTVNQIVQEVRRTTGGTVEARKYENDRRLVDDVLLAASGAQVVGKDPDGKPIDTYYLVNAVRRERISYGGNEYTDVWGFEAETPTVNDYARELAGQTNYYPLLEMAEPMTLNEAWIERYLKDVLHEARGNLYDKNGNRRRGVKQTTVKRSWSTIFETAKPLSKMTSRQKTSLVQSFEKILRTLADMDAKGKLYEGRPMAIHAYSKRNAAKGRGRGTWELLVIEATSSFKKPDVNLM